MSYLFLEKINFGKATRNNLIIVGFFIILIKVLVILKGKLILLFAPLQER